MKRVLVTEFFIAESDDLMVTVAQPLWDWEQTAQGKWIQEHGTQTEFRIVPDFNIVGHKVLISSLLSDSDFTFFKLRWP